MIYKEREREREREKHRERMEKNRDRKAWKSLRERERAKYLFCRQSSVAEEDEEDVWCQKAKKDQHLVKKSQQHFLRDPSPLPIFLP